MPVDPKVKDRLPYDWDDEESVLHYAAQLSKKRLRDLIEVGEEIIGGTRTKGVFGQVVEKEYFGMSPNNSPKPDFDSIGMELKVAPMKGVAPDFESKERMILGIIDYNRVPELGFRIFSDKGSHILILFYRWEADTDIYDYEFLKVVDWKPSETDLRIIKEDWNIIEGYVMRGEAHLLSERHTRYLAANTKGVGHGKDMRSQPFSDILAKQRSLSFKAPYVTSIYRQCPDVNDTLGDSHDPVDPEFEGSIFIRLWEEGMGFEEYVLRYFDRFVGRTCAEIESMLGMDLNDGSKQYYHRLVMAMFGLPDKRSVRELNQANISVKTIRIKKNGMPKEHIPFRAFKYEDIVEQAWEDSDLYEQIDREFLFHIFQFNTDRPETEARKELTYRGSFFWCLPDDDFGVIKGVWEDTKEKIIEERFDDFVRSSDNRISHVRPHARDKNDTYPYKGRNLIKKSFWLNAKYLKMVVKENLPGGSIQKKLD